MNNELWTYIQELKKGSIQLADLKNKVSIPMGNAFETAFAGLPSERPMKQKAQAMDVSWP
ncbi:hypothetical protein CDO73_20945 [Saccharibacillus sp. O23]|uniref:hypothetical protein n=1 Tax=Saccharibacillus sp. O23 TaxID=2009338 RepID=UPI000B4E6850|nr:hypothetical protein [Saccharibacillus sp. O23]OWR27663.1 hypothetical protein CDO73_20945 [Saccharibacillus sp. O23]